MYNVLPLLLQDYYFSEIQRITAIKTSNVIWHPGPPTEPFLLYRAAPFLYYKQSSALSGTSWELLSQASLHTLRDEFTEVEFFGLFYCRHHGLVLPLHPAVQHLQPYGWRVPLWLLLRRSCSIHSEGQAKDRAAHHGKIIELRAIQWIALTILWTTVAWVRDKAR